MKKSNQSIQGEKDFNNFIVQVRNIWQDYCVWSEMRFSSYQEIYDKNPQLWFIFFRSIQDRVLLNLHEIFNENPRTLNVYTLYKQINNQEIKKEAREIICKNCEIRIKLKGWRNNLVAHKNKKNIKKSLEELGEEYEIQVGFIESPIYNLFEILNKIQTIFSDEEKDYIKEMENIKKEVISDFKGFMSKV
jgi:hypothetical protein